MNAEQHVDRILENMEKRFMPIRAWAELRCAKQRLIQLGVADESYFLSKQPKEFVKLLGVTYDTAATIPMYCTGGTSCEHHCHLADLSSAAWACKCAQGVGIMLSWLAHCDAHPQLNSDTAMLHTVGSDTCIMLMHTCRATQWI
jgi:hypothetical protein